MKEITITTILCFTILVFTSPQVSQADPQLKIHRTYNFYSPFASPLVIIEDEKQYEYFCAKASIYLISSNPSNTSYEHSKINFEKQCLLILSAPSIDPILKDIRYENNTFVIDVEYSEIHRWWLNGDFRGIGILIDRPETTIKLSKKSANQYEEYYGNRLQCYRNSLNHTVDKDL